MALLHLLVLEKIFNMLNYLKQLRHAVDMSNKVSKGIKGW
jgi:hypothetical protein